jgi:hypothetical protein
MGAPPMMVDILPEISGIEFDAAWRRRVEAPVDADGGVIAPFISADDLLVAKLAAGRKQDLADVAAILKAQNTARHPRAAEPRRHRKALPTKP